MQIPSLTVLTILSLSSVPLTSQYLPRPPAPSSHSPLDSRFMLYKDLSGSNRPGVHVHEPLVNRQPQHYTPFPATYLLEPHLQTQPAIQESDTKNDVDYEMADKETRDQQLLPSAPVPPPRVQPTVGPQPRAGSHETRPQKHSHTRDTSTDPPIRLEPEPPSVFDREYARVEVDSNKEIRRQEEDEGKKDEFDEEDADDWDTDDWDDFDDGPLAERGRKEQENEEWELVRGRDHVRTKGMKRPPQRKRTRKRPVKNKKKLLNDLYYGQRVKPRKRKRVKGQKIREKEKDSDLHYVQVPRRKSSSQRHKRRRVPDPVDESYHESLYRNERKKRMPKGRADRRLRQKGSERRKRRRQKKPPTHEAIEEFEDDGRSAERMDGLPAKRRRHKPKRYSKNYVYIKKKPPSKEQDGVTDDYDVAYARGNYQAFVDEYDSDADEDPRPRPHAEESVAYGTIWST